MIQTYLVIHYLDHTTTLKETAVAKACGSNGVFIISHRGEDDIMLDAAWEAKQMFRPIDPDFLIGINMLTRTPPEAIAHANRLGLDMVWADYMGVSSCGLTPEAWQVSERANQIDLKLFAGVAFKYQRTEENPPLAAKLANDNGFIPTTSGEATGSAPNVEKISSMSISANGNLAIASGMTPDNIHLYAPHLKYILVSTGVSRDEHHVDPGKLTQLIANAISSGK